MLNSYALTVCSRMEESSSEDDDAYFFAICEKEYSFSTVLTHPWKRKNVCTVQSSINWRNE